MVASSKQQTPIPWYWNIVCGSIGGSVAELFTIPIDTAKVRLQIQGQKKAEMGAAYTPKYNGMFHAIKTIYVEEGVQSLWKGIFAGLQRQVVFAGIRIGLYDSVRNFICGDDPKNLTILNRIISALITGAVGITVASPTDVVKIRLQAEGRKPAGVPRRYNGSIDAYRKIVLEEGVKGLYSGLGANIIRNSVMNAAELASYDQIKSTIIAKFPKISPDATSLHFICGLAAGFIAVVFASPVDVVKTRVMNNPTKYGGAVSCFIKTLQIEGPGAFYGGFSANFWRVGTWNIIMFLTYEKCKYLVRRRLDLH